MTVNSMKIFIDRIRKGKAANAFINGTGLTATAIALGVMVILQCIVIGVNVQSFSEFFPKLWMSWLNILRNNTYTGIIAVGMRFVVVSGGIDLSVGSTTCAIGALIMYCLDSSGLFASIGIEGVPAYILAIVAALAAGVIFGEINGVLIANGRIPPFIVTLGTMKIFRSVTQQLASHFNPEVPAGFKKIASLKLGVPTFLCDAVRGAIIIFAVLVQRRKREG